MWTTHFAEISSATASAEWLGSRPGRDTLGVQVLNAIGTYAAAPAFGLNSSPVLSIVCIITASLRATATAALFEADFLPELQTPRAQSAVG